MKTEFILYNPADFGAVEIKEDTRDAELGRLRAENEKLRAVLKEVSVCLDGNRTGEDILSAVRSAAAALKETGDE